MHGTLRFLYLYHLLYGICVENLPYESVYFKKLHNEQESAIDPQYTEQGQL